MKIIFLGSGGARHMMQSQVRKTGGIFFDLEGAKFIVDPGPGSLVHAHSLKLEPEKWNGVMLSHYHVDNACDSNALLDGMKDPFLVAEEHCILPREKFKKKFNYYPCITPYHQKLVKQLHPVKNSDSVSVGSMKVTAVKAVHDDPCVGFVIKHPKITVGYAADGIYYKGQEKAYEGCDVLILNVIVPKGQKPEINKHMSVDGAIEFVRSMEKKPKLIVVHHLSFWMLRSNIFKQIKIIQDATKVRTINSEDFMELDLEKLTTRILSIVSPKVFRVV
jgi:ribonuclease BN (tRNA processing enzyme)